MDVAEWLRGLALDQYITAFRVNDIDGEVLRRLTADDLRELGVTSIGHRSTPSLRSAQQKRCRHQFDTSRPMAATPSLTLPGLRGREGWMPNAAN